MRAHAHGDPSSRQLNITRIIIMIPCQPFAAPAPAYILSRIHRKSQSAMEANVAAFVSKRHTGGSMPTHAPPAVMRPKVMVSGFPPLLLCPVASRSGAPSSTHVSYSTLLLPSHMLYSLPEVSSLPCEAGSSEGGCRAGRAGGQGGEGGRGGR